MTTSTTIIDCDPGNDDAIALLLAMASPEVALAAITVVAGNVGIEHTATNALEIVELAGREVPVFAGAARPLLHKLVTAAHIHGATGMQGLALPKPRRGLGAVNAVDHIRATLRAAPPRSVTLCAVGPLTNLALALATEPTIAAGIARIVLMGGGIALGNTTPAAEFNIYVDPHAAQIIFGSGVPIVMVPIDCTHQALATKPRVAAIRALGTPPAHAVADLMEAYTPREKFNYQGSPVHDACAVAYLIRPELMSGRECRVEIDISEGPSRGRTVVDWWGKRDDANALVLDRIDADGFFALLTERLARY
jgi:purine nucleosidase